MTDTDEVTSKSPRLLITLAITVTSALTFAALLIEDLNGFDDLEFDDLPWGLILRYMVTMALGGAVAGFLLAGMFGRRRIGGWFLAILGGVVATLLAGLLGSFFGWLPDYLSAGDQPNALVSILAGALVPIFAFAGRPVLFLLWVMLIVATHLLARRARHP